MNTREKRIWCLLYKHGSSPRSRSLCLCCFCRVCLRRLLSVAILPASAYLCLPACLSVPLPVCGSVSLCCCVSHLLTVRWFVVTLPHLSLSVTVSIPFGLFRLTAETDGDVLKQ